MQEDKRRFMARNDLSLEKFYLPSPGVPIKLQLEVGDKVLVDIRSRDMKSRLASPNIDDPNGRGVMQQLSGKWLTVTKPSYTNDYASDGYRLEGSSKLWSWYHFGAAVTKDGYFGDKTFPSSVFFSNLPNI